MYLTSYFWAGLFVGQATGAALIIRDASYSTGYNFDQILPLVAIGIGIAGSVLIGRHYASKGRGFGASTEAA